MFGKSCRVTNHNSLSSCSTGFIGEKRSPSILEDGWQRSIVLENRILLNRMNNSFLTFFLHDFIMLMFFGYDVGSPLLSFWNVLSLCMHFKIPAIWKVLNYFWEFRNFSFFVFWWNFWMLKHIEHLKIPLYLWISKFAGHKFHGLW